MALKREYAGLNADIVRVETVLHLYGMNTLQYLPLSKPRKVIASHIYRHTPLFCIQLVYDRLTKLSCSGCIVTVRILR